MLKTAPLPQDHTTYETETVDITSLRIESTIVLRTVEHIAGDLDQFSKFIRTVKRTDAIVEAVEHHLALARRNCAEATTIAHEILAKKSGYTTFDEEILRDAFACLTLADSAYLKAFETAGPS